MKPHLCSWWKHFKDSFLIYIFTLKIRIYCEAECRSLTFLKALPPSKTQLSTNISLAKCQNWHMTLHVLYACTDSIPGLPLNFSQDSSGYDAVGNRRHGDRRTPAQGQHIQVAACSLGDIPQVGAPPVQVPSHHPPFDAHIYDTCNQSKTFKSEIQTEQLVK